MQGNFYPQIASDESPIFAGEEPEDFYEFTAADYAALQASKKEGLFSSLSTVLYGAAYDRGRWQLVILGHSSIDLGSVMSGPESSCLSHVF